LRFSQRWPWRVLENQRRFGRRQLAPFSESKSKPTNEQGTRHSVYILLVTCSDLEDSVRRWQVWWSGNDLEGSGRGQIEALSLEGLRKSRGTSVRIVAVSAEIRTKHLPNISLQHKTCVQDNIMKLGHGNKPWSPIKGGQYLY
jgi:hypothetical protein